MHLLLALAACDPAAPAPAEAELPVAPALQGVLDPHATDYAPGRRTLSPSGAWEIVVRPGGALSVRRAGSAEERAIATGVDPRVGVSADERFVVYAAQAEWGETDLWRVDLAGGAPARITDWPGSEDRPVLSPDGRRLAFVSGRTGIASWWVIDLEDGVSPVASATQLTNVGVRLERPGVAPTGFVPVPGGTTYTWTGESLVWVAEARQWRVDVPPSGQK